MAKFLKLKKFFQKVFKKTFQSFFIFFYGRISRKHNNKELNFEQEEINLVGSNKKILANNYLYIINDGRVYTDLNEHVAIIKDNYLLPNISYQQVYGELKNVEFNKTLETGTPRILKKFNGNVLTLVQGASGNNYFHFLFDVITKLKLCEQNFNLNEIDFFYLPGTTSWQKKILSIFNIFEDRMINSQKYRHIKAENLLALEHPWYKEGFVQKEINKIPEWIIFYLREKFLSYKQKFESNDKIFIDRSDSLFNHCKLINNNEVMEFLKDKGFSSYRVSDLDFFEQIYLFNNAKIIIGPHGAAFTNLIFSNPGLKLIEILPEDHLSIKCEKFSKILNFNLKKIKVPRIKNNINGDMFLKIDKIINF